MNEVTDLIARYHQIKPNAKGEQFGKIHILAELEYLSDQRILPFFLDRLLDTSEYDLARIEILKILAARKNDASEYQVVARAISSVLQNKHDDEFVKLWAAQEAERFLEDDELMSTLLGVILNPEEDMMVRENALAAINLKGIDVRSVEKLKAVEFRTDDDDEEREFVRKVRDRLDKWKTEANKT